MAVDGTPIGPDTVRDAAAHAAPNTVRDAGGLDFAAPRFT